MLRKNTDREWERFGTEDPYYGVVSAQQFRSGNMTSARRDQFFHTGERHVAELFSVIHRHTCPGFSPKRTLDFGCGVGRLTIPLARQSDIVLGADVSESMLAEAQRNMRQFGVTNVSFVRSDDDLTEVSGTFDFVHSFIVLQHIPVRRGMKIIDRLLGKISPGGIGAIHVTYGREETWAYRAVYSLIKSNRMLSGLASGVRGQGFASPIMQLNRYDMSQLMEQLYFSGCNNIHLEHTSHRGALGWFLFFRKHGGVANHSF